MFDAVIDSLSCAVHIQRELKNLNRDLPDERKVQFRIGVNLGDVIEDRGDIYGDGVNVAARLEGLADAGGVCISGAVHNAIGMKLPFDYEWMGEQQVKNIANPVRVYRVSLGMAASKTDAESALPALSVPAKPSVAVLRELVFDRQRRWLSLRLHSLRTPPTLKSRAFGYRAAYLRRGVTGPSRHRRSLARRR